MPKNIVVCCDGTGNEFGEENSNVVKLCQILVRDRADQHVYYDPGVGTTPIPDRHRDLRNTWYKIKGLAFAAGISANIQAAYTYLMNAYEPGDNLYLFGFSRGAFTARAIAGMVHQCGLLSKHNEPMVGYAYKLYRDVFDEATLDKFRATYSRECKPHFVGVWDTVSSVGWAWDRETFPATYRNPDISVARHAISIDERRAKFRTNKFAHPVSAQDIREVWFAGVHSDVGGGYPEIESGLSKIALKWLVDEACAHGLLVRRQAYEDVVLGADHHYAPPDPRAVMHDSLKGAWEIVEWIPLPRYNYEEGRDELVTYHSKPRDIARHSTLHQSVVDRMRDDHAYKPVNVPDEYEVEPVGPTPSNLVD